MHPERKTAPPRAAPARWRQKPGLAVLAVVLLAFSVYASLALLVETPRIFYDELIYMEAAASLASGEGLSFRGEPYEYGLLYPAVLSPVLLAFPDREVAYELAKLLNALLFALAAIPVYLLARRLLPPWPSVGVAALAIAIPSAMYVTVVMTESLAYLAACWALYAIVMVLERPTVARQGAALAAIVLAFLTRPQFLGLYVAYLLGLSLVALVVPERRARWRRRLATLWPTLLSLVLGFAAFVVLPLVQGADPSRSLGKYDALWRSYDPATVVKWLAYHAADLELYLAAIPVAVAPIVLASAFARARAGSDRHAAFFATFVAFNAVTLALVAVVVTFQESSGSEVERLHDRYVFYVVPLWLVALFVWFDEGAHRPALAAGIGVAMAVVLPALMPLADLDVNDGAKIFNAVATGIPATVAKAVQPEDWLGRIVLAALALALVLLAFRRRAVPVRVALVALGLVFFANGALAWGKAYNPLERHVFQGAATDRRWVDDLVPEDVSVTTLYIPCREAFLARDALILTEFFNSSVEAAIQLGGDLTVSVRRAANGSIVASSGDALRADYVVTQSGVDVRGRRIGEGTAARLVLWDVDGELRVDEIQTSAACPEARST